MKHLITLIFLFFSVISFGQISDEPNLSGQDSVLLTNFWKTLKEGIQNNDKQKLSSICNFPFICSQCMDDTTIKHKNQYYVKASRKIFDKSAYKIFFEKIFVDFVNRKEMPRDLYIFGIALDEKEKKAGYEFNYLVNRIPGRQIFVYLEKHHGIYKISATETRP
ncbi:MAG: hypothetical protein ABI685_05800 [Ferruginibacter sp.]